MKTPIKVRNHTHVFEQAGDIAYRKNSFSVIHKEWFINTMALTLSLMISGADPLQVLSPESPFFRAAKDIWYYMREDVENKYWTIRTQPIYEHDGIGIVYIRNHDHCPEIKWYKRK